MPAKLDRCVDKVIAKGNSKSSAFAICTKSVGLSKTAISEDYISNKAKKLIVNEMSIRDKKNDFAEEYHIQNGGKRVGERDAFSGSKARPDEVMDRKSATKYKALQRLEDRYSTKATRAEILLDKKKAMNKNLEEFGKRKVGTSERVAKAAGKFANKIKGGLKSLIPSGKELAPAALRLVR
jgi:hypothetical protein